jgi:RimJ/RimL family protein N-acetyltransferase
MKKEDEGLLKALNQRPETLRFIGSLENLYDEPHAKVIEKDNGISAGIVAVIKSQAMDGTDYELLCALLMEYEGQGIATKACREMLKMFFSNMPLNRVIGCIDRANTSSLALIKRLGGTFLQKRDCAFKEQDIYVLNDLAVQQLNPPEKQGRS